MVASREIHEGIPAAILQISNYYAPREAQKVKSLGSDWKSLQSAAGIA
jgi:hypothetical protein